MPSILLFLLLAIPAFDKIFGDVILEFKQPFERQTSMTLDSRQAQFGAFINGFVGRVQYIPAPDNYGCKPLAVFPESNETTIAVLSRGQGPDTPLPLECTFTMKVKNAQDAGFDGVIVYDSVDESLIVMGGYDASLVIPSVFVSMASGAILAQAPSATLATLTADPILQWPSFLVTFVIVVSVVIFLFTVFMLYRRRVPAAGRGPGWGGMPDEGTGDEPAGTGLHPSRRWRGFVLCVPGGVQAGGRADYPALHPQVSQGVCGAVAHCPPAGVPHVQA